MKIGLFFGSFNPIHIGHLIIANYMAYNTDIDEVWLVVSPHNPFKLQSDLVHTYDRLEMARLATDEAERVCVCDIEMSLPRPSYTIDTLSALKEKYPKDEFALIMGGDNLKTFNKWKNYEAILKDYSIYVYPRDGQDLSEWSEYSNIHITDAPQMDLSATFIRKSIADHKSVRYFVHDKVLEFIERKSLYSTKFIGL
jgi:nicotinate-nucleotide adenylyltransferase